MIEYRGIGRRGDRVDGVRADERLDIQEVAVGGILRPGTGPERPLDLRPFCTERGETRAFKYFLERLIHEFGIRDSNIAEQSLHPGNGGRVFLSGDLLPQEIIDERVDAADKNARNGGDAGDRLSLFRPELESLDVGACHFLVPLDREYERNVDVVPFADRPGDRREPLFCRGDLHHDIFAVDPGGELPDLRVRGLSVPCLCRGHLDTDVAIPSSGPVVGDPEEIGRHLYVFHHEGLNDLRSRGLRVLRQDLTELRVVVGAPRYRFVEYRRIGRHPEQPLVNKPAELAACDERSADVVVPDALAEFFELLQCVLHCRSPLPLVQFNVPCFRDTPQVALVI